MVCDSCLWLWYDLFSQTAHPSLLLQIHTDTVYRKQQFFFIEKLLIQIPVLACFYSLSFSLFVFKGKLLHPHLCFCSVSHFHPPPYISRLICQGAAPAGSSVRLTLFLLPSRCVCDSVYRGMSYCSVEWMYRREAECESVKLTALTVVEGWWCWDMESVQLMCVFIATKDV